MIFSSLSFIFLLLPLFFLFDFFTREFASIKWRNTILVFISLLFYTWGEASYVLWLIGLSLFNYYAGNIIFSCKKPRLYVSIFISVNLAILFGFKYALWLGSFISPSLSFHSIEIPLGMSFFTFHSISYLIDIYRGNITPATSALNFSTYFCMFPHLVAGPIVRYAQVCDNLDERGPNKDLFSFGMYRFLVGLNKKVLIANTVSDLAESAFSLSGTGHLYFFDAWIGIIAYAIQIYFDFSGYSDMAIGLAAMLGFHFEENFLRPYLSSSVREFWKRWHVSLSSWLRDYVYITLGGSRKGSIITYRNLLIVFFLCGVWHGANITFILWGIWHGTFLVIERLLASCCSFRFPKWISRIYTLLVILIGWVFFRAENLQSSVTYLKEMFFFSSSPCLLSYYFSSCFVLLIGIILCLIPERFLSSPTSKSPTNFSHSSYFLQIFLAAVSIISLLVSMRTPFIYFSF